MNNLNKHIKSLLREHFAFNKTFSDLTEKDLYSIAKWGLEGDFNFSACWDDADDNIDVAAKCVVQDFKDLLGDKFPECLGDFPRVATLYRFITLTQPEALDKSKVGKSWFADPNTIDNPDFNDQLLHLTRCRDANHGLYLLTANIPIENVDIARTLWQRSLTYIENEVVIKDDSNVNIIAIKKIAGPRGK